MLLVADFGRNPPDRPFVPALKVISGFRTCRMFRLSGYSVRLIPGIRFELLPEVVFRGFGEEKHLLEIHRKTVFDRGRHSRGLVPYNLVAQYPPPQDHHLGEQPRDIAQRFVRNSVYRQIDAQCFQTMGVFTRRPIVCAVVFIEFAVRIAEVHP